MMEQLRKICSYRGDKAQASSIGNNLYVSTENMHPNKSGITRQSNAPSEGTVSHFHKGDTLVSNIRPYFKKVWLADTDGYCSNDVLVFKPISCSSSYLHWILCDDRFFDYMMSTSKGTKMPRGDKSAIMNYPITIRNLKEQEAIASILHSFQAKIELNNHINDYLAATCEEIAKSMQVQANSRSTLEDVCYIVAEKAPFSKATFDSYVSTESLLPNKEGRQTTSSLPSTGKVTVYQSGDVLVSNIRPYFKKIWFSNQNGTCSNDVIVFRAKNARLAPYLWSVLRNDNFFEYMMAGAKGTKMPRGDRKQIMHYPIATEYSNSDLNALKSMVRQISLLDKENFLLVNLRDTVLPKLVSGAIDVSEIEVPS